MLSGSCFIAPSTRTSTSMRGSSEESSGGGGIADEVQGGTCEKVQMMAK